MPVEPNPADAQPLRSVEAARTAVVRGAAYAIGFIASVVIARVLGPTGRGEYVVAVTVASTAMAVGHLSVEQANLYLWSERGERSRLVGAAIATGIAAGLAAVLFTGFVLAAGPWLDGTDPVLLVVALAAVPAGIAALYLNGLLVADGQLRAMNLATGVAAVGQTAVVLVLAALGELTVLAVVVVWAVVTILPLAVQIPALARRPGIARPDRALVREAVGIGLRYHPGMVAVFLVLRVDIFMLEGLSTTAAVGIYSLAVTLTEATYLVTDPIAQAAVSAQVGEARGDAAYTARIARTNLVVSGLLMLALVAVAPIAVPLVFGEPFGPSVGPIVALALGTVAWSFQRPLGVFAVQQHRPWLVTAVSATALAVNVGLNLVLIPRLVEVGAALASTVTYTSLTLFYVVWFLRRSGSHWRILIPQVDDVRGPAVAVARRLRSVLSR